MLEPEPRGASTPEATPASKLLAFERLLAELSARFVNLSASKVDGAIVDALRQFVGIIGVDRSGLRRLRDLRALRRSTYMGDRCRLNEPNGPPRREAQLGSRWATRAAWGHA